MLLCWASTLHSEAKNIKSIDCLNIMCEENNYCRLHKVCESVLDKQHMPSTCRRHIKISKKRVPHAGISITGLQYCAREDINLQLLGATNRSGNPKVGKLGCRAVAGTQPTEQGLPGIISPSEGPISQTLHLVWRHTIPCLWRFAGFRSTVSAPPIIWFWISITISREEMSLSMTHWIAVCASACFAAFKTMRYSQCLTPYPVGRKRSGSLTYFFLVWTRFGRCQNAVC